MSRRITGDLVRPSNVVTLASSCINIGHPATFPVVGRPLKGVIA